MDTVSNIMDHIIQCEQLQITPETKKYILTFSKYSIREIISHLEKITILSNIGETIAIDKCKQIISDISYKEFEKYIILLKNDKIDDAVQILYNIHDYGYSVIDILDKFYAFVKNTELIDEDKKYNLLPILCKYITYFHNLHEDIIEVVLFTQDFYKSLSN
jgi:DNA polymerase III gamma/tau subunit